MKIETLNSLWYDDFTTKPLPPWKSEEIKISWVILYHIVALGATHKNYINMAKTNSVIKDINAVFVNINLLPLIKNLTSHANIPLVLFAARLHSFITIITIILIFAAVIKNAIILSFRLSLPLSCLRLCLTFLAKPISNAYAIVFILLLLHSSCFTSVAHIFAKLICVWKCYTTLRFHMLLSVIGAKNLPQYSITKWLL